MLVGGVAQAGVTRCIAKVSHSTNAVFASKITHQVALPVRENPVNVSAILPFFIILTVTVHAVPVAQA